MTFSEWRHPSSHRACFLTWWSTPWHGWIFSPWLWTISHLRSDQFFLFAPAVSALWPCSISTRWTRAWLASGTLGSSVSLSGVLYEERLIWEEGLRWRPAGFAILAFVNSFDEFLNLIFFCKHRLNSQKSNRYNEAEIVNILTKIRESSYTGIFQG